MEEQKCLRALLSLSLAQPSLISTQIVLNFPRLDRSERNLRILVAGSEILLKHPHIILSCSNYIVYLSRSNSIAFTTYFCSPISPASPTPLPLATTLAPPRGYHRAYGVDWDIGKYWHCTWHLFAFPNSRIPYFSPEFPDITWPLARLVTKLA